MVRLKQKEIIDLIKAGKESEIEGYIINWHGPAPCELYNEYVNKGQITITGKDVPTPDRALVVGGFEPVFTPDITAFRPLDFGNIYLRTEFVLNKFVFEYDSNGTERIKKLMEYLESYAETPTGRRFKKSDICFDVKLEMCNAEINACNAFLSNVDFQFDENKEVTQIVADLVYDYVHIDFTDDIKKRGD